MAADGWNGQSVRAHVEHAAGVASQATIDVEEVREELAEMESRLAGAERAAADAVTLAQRTGEELAAMRSVGGKAALEAPAEPPAQTCTGFLNFVEGVAGSAALAVEAVETLHADLAELKRRAVCMSSADLARSGCGELGEVKPRLEKADQSALVGLEAVASASNALEALAEWLAALEARAQGAADV